MSDENQTEVSENTSGPVITIEKKTTDVLDANGKSLNSTNTPLSSIFDKIAEGKDAKEAVGEVMKDVVQPKKRPLFDEKKEEVVEQKEVVEEEKEEEIVIDKTSEAAKEKAEEKPAPEAEKKAEDEEIAEEELQVLPHDKPKTARRIDALLKKSHEAQRLADETKKQAEEKDKRLKELEEQLSKVQSADPLTNEKVKAHLEELGMYRRRYELENDPAIKEKFDSRITNSEETIVKTLTDRGAPATILAIVKEEGGWLKFVDSQRTIKLADGSEPTAAEVAEIIRNALPLSERRRLESLELEQIQVSRDKQTYFNEESKKAKDYFSEHEAKTRAEREAQRQAFEQAVKVANEWRSKFVQENEWLREKEIAANLTKEQKAALEDHNTHAKQLNQLIEKHLAAKDLNEMLSVLSDAIQYHQERRKLAGTIAENERLKKQLEAKQAELDRVRSSGNPIQKGGSLRASSSSSAEPAKQAQPESLEAAFDRIAAGKSANND